MAKRVCLLLLGCILAVCANPAILVADGHFGIKAPDFGHAEVLSEAPEVPETAEPAPVAISMPLASPSELSLPSAANLPAPATVNYTVTTVVGSISEFVSIHQNLSYSQIYRFESLVYGHNSANLLGNLGTLAVGQIFTITEANVARNYRVANVVYYQNTAEGLNGDPTLMSQIAYGALGHSVAVMTCAGQMYGNGKASQRLVVFADLV